MEITNVSSLVQGGAVGISIALIILFAYFMRLVFKFAGNHINHLTEAINNVCENLKEINTYLKNQNGKK